MKIESYKKLKNGKYEVKFENDTKILLYEDAILDAELLRKKEISENELNRIVALNERYEVYNKSIKFLSVKMRCEKEIKSKTTLKYTDEKNAKLVYDSLEVDNEGFVQSVLDEDVINFKIESDKLGSFLATADDLIASEILAEEIIKKTSPEDILK